MASILSRTPDLNKWKTPDGRISTLDLIAGLSGNLLEIINWCKSNGKHWPLDEKGDDTREVGARLLCMEAKLLLTEVERHTAAEVQELYTSIAPVDDLLF